MTSRISRLTDQPDATNRVARWSSNSGWVGVSPSRPKLSGVRTSPWPNRCCQMRLTITRAVSGLSGEAIQSASSSRPLPLVRCPRGVWSSPARITGKATRDDLALLAVVAADVDRRVADVLAIAAGDAAFLDADGDRRRRLRLLQAATASRKRTKAASSGGSSCQPCGPCPRGASSPRPQAGRARFLHRRLRRRGRLAHVRRQLLDLRAQLIRGGPRGRPSSRAAICFCSTAISASMRLCSSASALLSSGTVEDFAGEPAVGDQLAGADVAAEKKMPARP